MMCCSCREAATITASIYRDDGVDSSINKGKVVFKVNGKTLKDSEGKVIYDKVTCGVAGITDFEVPFSWTKNDTVITVVYFSIVLLFFLIFLY